MTVLLHSEATGDPRTVRWVTNINCVPGSLIDELRLDGTLAAVEVADGEIRTRLASGRCWSGDGPRVRTALFQALSAIPASDDRLRDQIARLVAHEVGPFVASHGGSVQVVSVIDGVVTVALEGACGPCSLRNATLNDLILSLIRAKFPDIRAVRAGRSSATPIGSFGPIRG